MPYKLLIAVGMASAIALLVLMIAGGTVAMGRALFAPATPAAGISHDTGAETVAWCGEAGGTIVMRTAALTPDADPPGVLGEPEPFCEFTGGAGADEGSMISVLAESLSSTQPTMAAMAYLQGKPMPAIDPPANATPGAMTGIPNPASIYCQQAGGVEGAWVALDMAADAPFRNVSMCVFPDRSAIESWGIAYHAMGSVRGADLTNAFAWKP
jgi:putative hemolysin